MNQSASTELLPLDDVNATAIFQEDGLKALLDAIVCEARSHVPDMETAAGRKKIASLAYNVSQSKTYLDSIGKTLVSEWKDKAKSIDAERKVSRETLDQLRDEIRKPLTEWENKKKIEDERCACVIAEIATSGDDCIAKYSTMPVVDLEQYLDRATSIDPTDGFGDFEENMTEVRLVAIGKISTAIEQRIKFDAEQAELATLRADKAARDEADAAAQQQRQQEARDAEIARKAREGAEEREQQAVADKEAAELSAKQARETAEREAQERIDADIKRENDEQERLARNKRHRANIHTAIIDDLNEIGITVQDAKIIVTAVANNQITSLFIDY